MDVAILDDYQAVAQQMADWSQLPSGVNVLSIHTLPSDVKLLAIHSFWSEVNVLSTQIYPAGVQAGVKK